MGTGLKKLTFAVTPDIEMCIRDRLKAGLLSVQFGGQGIHKGFRQRTSFLV